MDLGKLIEPYSENGRTIGGQIKWLSSKGMPQHIIESAMSFVYKEVELGKTFANGSELDKELLLVARKTFDKELEKQLKERLSFIESNLDTEWNKLSKAKKIWQVIKGIA